MLRILAGEGLPAGGQVSRTGQTGYLPQDSREADLRMIAATDPVGADWTVS